ncbi:hypothetical protein ABE288_05840 [Bacillus salipaludis]|uniref:hypothetical protein n=1 Tax=Bacillus salipaludis TaxID=2547811 RepID=UPI003D240ADD
MKKKILIFSICTFIVGLYLFNSSVFAESKKHLAQLVMEHEIKIANLEDMVKKLSLSSVSKGDEDFTPEVKKALLKEIEIRLQYNPVIYDDPGYGKKINITHYDIKKVNGIVTLQFFTEGDYDWGRTTRDYGADGVMLANGSGRAFAMSVISNFDDIFKLYGFSNIRYEFYQNGERVKFSPEIE